MPKTRQQKTETVANLVDKLSKAKSVIFADYRGLTMAQLSQLRRKLNEEEAQFLVTKNSLLKLALDRKKRKAISDKQILDGPIATLFSYGDEILPIKTLAKLFKDISIGSIKGGFLNGEFLEGSNLTKLASLPSKDELRAKIIGGLATPLYGIVEVLQANLRNLVYALDQIKISRGGE